MSVDKEKKKKNLSPMMVSTDSVRNIVREALQALVNGELYMKIGLEEHSLKLLTNQENKDYEIFMNHLIETFTMKEKSKKEKKKLAKFFKEKKDIITVEIKTFINERNKNSVVVNDVMDSTVNESSNNADNEIPNELTNSTKKKKKKQKKTEVEQPHSLEPSPPSLEPSPPSSNFQEDEYLTPRQKQLKNEFEEEKERILGELPAEHKKRFRSIVFSKWSKEYLPALEISPYDVEPGPVRDQWMKMFHKTRKSGRPPTHLIYWYGVQWDNRSEAYSFVPKKNLKTFKQGIEEGYDKLPATIQKKIKTGKPLTSMEEFHKAALEDLEEDRKLPPNERIQWMLDFQEDYMYAEDDDPMDVQPTTPPKEKKKKGRKKKIVEDSQEEPQEEPQEVLQELQMEEFNEEEHPSSNDDYNDNDFYDTSSKKKEKKRKLERGKTKKTKKKKVEETNEEYESKTPIKKRKAKIADDMILQEEKPALHIEEQVQLMIPIVETTLSSIDTADTQIIMDFLTTIKVNCDTISTEFLETSGLPELLKSMKRAFKSNPECSSCLVLCKDVFKIMKNKYLGSATIENQVNQGSDENGDDSLKDVDNVHAGEEQMEENLPLSKPSPKEEESAEEDSELFPEEEEEQPPSPKEEQPSPKREDLNNEETEMKPASLSVPRKRSNQEEVKRNQEEVKRNQEEVKPKAPPPSARPIKKSFTLKGMLQGPKPTPSIPTNRKESSDKSSQPQEKQIPKWLTDGKINPITTNVEDRSFAYEFFLDAFSFVPPSILSKINKDFASRELESAVNKYTTEYLSSQQRSNEKFTIVYWEKIHDVVAAIRGKHKKKHGTIVDMMLEGIFPSAYDIVKLSRKQHHQSFEGEVVTL